MRLVVGLVQICPFRKNTFQNKDKSETFGIRKGILNCSSSLVVYLVQCKSCSRQYVGSTITPFRTRFNNYKGGARKVSKFYPSKCNVYQEQFQCHFNSQGHNCMEDWKITIIDSARNVLELRRRESYWKHSFNTLNERYLFHVSPGSLYSIWDLGLDISYYVRFQT